MIQAQNKLENQKEYLDWLLEQLTLADLNSSPERKAIAKQYPGSIVPKTSTP